MSNMTDFLLYQAKYSNILLLYDIIYDYYTKTDDFSNCIFGLVPLAPLSHKSIYIYIYFFQFFTIYQNTPYKYYNTNILLYNNYALFFSRVSLKICGASGTNGQNPWKFKGLNVPLSKWQSGTEKLACSTYVPLCSTNVPLTKDVSGTALYKLLTFANSRF